MAISTLVVPRRFIFSTNLTMFQVVAVSVLCWLALGQIAHSQGIQQSAPYPSRYHHRNSLRPQQVPTPVVPQNRRYNWINHLKKFQRQKLKHFKKYFRKCGISPFKFKIFRRSDDGHLDTIHVIVPYGFNDEYFPQPDMGERFRTEGESDGIDKVVPLQYRPENLTRKRNLYSVRYRKDNSGSDGHGNGTTDGTTGNLRR